MVTVFQAIKNIFPNDVESTEVLTAISELNRAGLKKGQFQI